MPDLADMPSVRTTTRITTSHPRARRALRSPEELLPRTSSPETPHQSSRAVHRMPTSLGSLGIVACPTRSIETGDSPDAGSTRTALTCALRPPPEAARLPRVVMNACELILAPHPHSVNRQFCSGGGAALNAVPHTAMSGRCGPAAAPDGIAPPQERQRPQRQYPCLICSLPGDAVGFGETRKRRPPPE